MIPVRDRPLTTHAAAERLAVTRQTILRWIHAGTLPASRYPSGQWRIAEATIAKLQAPARITP